MNVLVFLLDKSPIYKLKSKGTSIEPRGSHLLKVICLLFLAPITTAKNLLLDIPFIGLLIVLHLASLQYSDELFASYRIISYHKIYKGCSGFQLFLQVSSLIAVSDGTWS